jgi:hypothetical protein|tara:strand:- start:511 stop:783 length:273 start_codon:yes stop_codon:yes gene_type:complete
MIHNIDGVNKFFTPYIKYFNEHMTRSVKKFVKDKEPPLRFVVNIGVDGGNQNDKDFVAFGIVQCMNEQLGYNVELKRSGNCFIVKECCDE